MMLLSVNIGRPRDVMWNGQIVQTGIFKEPISGSVKLRSLNLEGDQQADLSVHGGPFKAVYVYPREHYDYWSDQLPNQDLPLGVFGENFTTRGLNEDDIFIGDVFSIGKARVVVTEPRMPCFKLAIRFNRPDMPKRFMKSQRMGFYFSVLEEGKVEAGDKITLLVRDESGLKLADVTKLYTTEKRDKELLSRAVSTDALPESWRQYFEIRLDKLRKSE